MTTTRLELERERLARVMADYLDALVRHDVGAVRIAPVVRNTENTIALPVGTGLWRTIRAHWPGGHVFVDPVAGEVEYWGTVDENGSPTIFGVRLRVEGTTITEIETLAVRGSPGKFFEPEVVSDAQPGFHAPIPEAERRPRVELVAIVDLYFDAIEQSDGGRLPVIGDCRRLVNGTLDSVMDADLLDPLDAHRALGVEEQMDAGNYAYIEALRDRRYPIVDEERGLVICHLLFDHPGDRQRSDGELVYHTPNTMIVFEAFKIRDGILEEVWAIGTALPYGIGSGWSAR
ncbi:MAG: hypothetical protein J7496_01940 [Novosphingobium sp.]|nr:hypothetical protein [Novosphingobium sp.]